MSHRLRVFWWPIALLLLGTTLPVTAADAERPNVIVIMTDDQGMGDFSYFGNPVLKTPNMDAVAHSAVRLTDFHVAPMCSPTRGQLLTGVDAVRNGVTSVTAGRTFLRPGFPVLAQMLKANGYATGIFGKWHLGESYPHRPIDRGFDESVYHLGWGMLQSTPDYGNPLIDGRYFHNGQPKKFTGHCTDFWFDQATAWIKQQGDKHQPFFCYIPTNAPHGPHIDLPQYIEPYRGKGPAGFFGMIAHVDERIGKLEQFLKDSGLRENTLFIFLTDNGGTSGVKTFNAGLRGGKTTYYDGGHRVPCWVRWPAGNLGKARDIDTPTQVQDLAPTILEFCGAPKPAGVKFDGTSLAGLLRGKKNSLPDRKMVVQYSRDTLTKWDSCVIWNQWRLVKGEELYDVVNDRAQKQNLAAEQPDTVKVMRAHYETWWAGMGPKPNEYVPILLGTTHQPEVTLTSGDWEGIYADNTGHVRNAIGGPRGGHWHVTFDRPGEYEFVLRRWPRETGVALGAGENATGEQAKVSGKAYNPPAKTFPIAEGVVSVAGKEASARTQPTAQDVTVKLTLPAGRSVLNAWFRDADGQDQCGAFFVYVKRVSGK